MNMHDVGHCTRDQACRIDTKKLGKELSKIDSRANVVFGQAKGRGAIFVECRHESAKCAAAVEAQAARLGISLA
jgi:hypothetical protein